MYISNSHTGEAETGAPQGLHTGEVETGGPQSLQTGEAETGGPQGLHTGEVETGGPQGSHTGEVDTGGPQLSLASPSSQSYRLHVQGDAGSKTKVQKETKREEPGMHLSPLHMSTQPRIAPHIPVHRDTCRYHAHKHTQKNVLLMLLYIIDFDCVHPVTLSCMLL